MSLAADSGGFTVRNSNDLAAGLKRIADETRAYYLIGYNPTNTARDGAFRKIEVKVRGRRGLEVRARKGLLRSVRPRRGARAAAGEDPVFQAALDSPYELGDVPLRMTHFVREETTLDRARVFLAAEVDVRRLALLEKDGQSKGALQYLMVAVQRDGGQAFRFDQTLELALPPETREQLSRTWLPIVREFELPTGRYRAKMVVRDKVSGRMGTRHPRLRRARPQALPGLDPRPQRRARGGAGRHARASGSRSWPGASSRRASRSSASSTSTGR